MTKPKISRFHLFFFLVIIITYLSLRLYQLNHVPIFVDEAIYIRWSQVMKNEPTLRFLPQSDGKQPLFMWLTIPFLKVVSDPLIAGRLVSVASGLGSLLGIGILAFLFTKSVNISLLTSLIYTITPFTVFFDRMSLVDSLLSMFGIYSLVFGIIFVKTTRFDIAMLLGFVLGGALLTKSPAIFFYAWQAVLFLFFSKNLFLKKQRNNTLVRIAKYVFGYFTAFVISQAMFNILRLGPNFHLINSRNQDYIFSFNELLNHPLNPLIGNLKSSLFWLIILFTWPIIIFIFSSFFDKKQRKNSLSLLSLCLIPLFAQAFVAKVYTPRYILFATTPLLVLAGLGIKPLFNNLKNKNLRFFLPALLLIFPFIRSVGYVTRPENTPMPQRMRNGYFEMWTAGTGQKQVAEYLIKRLSQNNNKNIIVGTEGFFGTLPDGLQIYTQDHPRIIVIGVGIISSMPEALTNSLSDPNNEVYLLVNKTRNLLPQNDLAQLELIAEYPKAKLSQEPIRGITQEVLQFYRLR